MLLRCYKQFVRMTNSYNYTGNNEDEKRVVFAFCCKLFCMTMDDGPTKPKQFAVVVVYSLACDSQSLFYCKLIDEILIFPMVRLLCRLYLGTYSWFARRGAHVFCECPDSVPFDQLRLGRVDCGGVQKM